MVFHRHPLGITVFFVVHVLMIFADIGMVYVVLEYGRHEDEGFMKTSAALLIHFFYIMTFISHVRASFSDPGYVPHSHIKIDFSSDLEHREKRKKRKKEPPPLDQWTACTKCETYRPPRSHHCRICRRCVRRMDHHCPWINNCVGELNFKYFYLFLIYAFSFSQVSLLFIILDWVYTWHEDTGTVDKIVTLFLFFEAVVFGIFVGGLAMTQTFSVLCDRNVIEIRRYGRPTKFPDTPWIVLMTALLGRGPKVFWPFPCFKARIPDPVPPSDVLTDIHQYV